MIECNKERCQQRYIGETDRKLIDRMSEHIGYVRNKKLNQATGFHFNQPGHYIHNMTFTVIEQVRKRNNSYRKERELYHTLFQLQPLHQVAKIWNSVLYMFERLKVLFFPLLETVVKRDMAHLLLTPADYALINAL